MWDNIRPKAAGSKLFFLVKPTPPADLIAARIVVKMGSVLVNADREDLGASDITTSGFNLFLCKFGKSNHFNLNPGQVDMLAKC